MKLKVHKNIYYNESISIIYDYDNYVSIFIMYCELVIDYWMLDEVAGWT